VHRLPYRTAGLHVQRNTASLRSSGALQLAQQRALASNGNQPHPAVDIPPNIKEEQAQKLDENAGSWRESPAHVDSPFHFAIPVPEKQPQHMLQLENVDAGYRPGHPVLRGVNVHLVAGTRLGLLGVNGAGKSTLVKALADGSTVLAGERIIHRDTRIGYFTQHQLDLLHPAQSPLDHCRSRAGHPGTNCATTSAASALPMTGFSIPWRRSPAGKRPVWCWP
jgi:ATPase subunit of ABC transporter with duplicated ATPase domains